MFVLVPKRKFKLLKLIFFYIFIGQNVGFPGLPFQKAKVQYSVHLFRKITKAVDSLIKLNLDIKITFKLLGELVKKMFKLAHSLTDIVVPILIVWIL